MIFIDALVLLEVFDEDWLIVFIELVAGWLIGWACGI